MGRISRISESEPDERRRRQLDIVERFVSFCRLYMEAGESDIAIGAVSTTLAVLMAVLLVDSDKDSAMDAVNEILNDTKKATFLQIKCIEETEKKE